MFPPLSSGGGGGGNDTLESTYIPNNLARWREESLALDGPTSHLCIAALRPIILKILKEEFDKQKKQLKDTSLVPPPAPPTVAPPITTSQPCPSSDTPTDTPTTQQATQSSHDTTTPRDHQSIDNLQSSLREVANALAANVSTGVRNMEEGGVTTPPTTSDGGVARSVASMPDLSSFDGSQDSARAMLSRIRSDDPLFTFLSAVARAPTPPLPDSLPPSSSAPRLPVFTQLLPPPPSLTNPPVATSTSTTTGTSGSSGSISVSVIPVIQYPPTTTGTNVTAASNTTSHDTIQSQNIQLASTGNSSNFADVLATELARAVSNHLVSTTTTSYDHLSPPPSLPPPPPSLSINVPLAMGSPSPSDTLAPLMSSLQMPPPAVPISTSVHPIPPLHQSDEEEEEGISVAAATIGSPTDEASVEASSTSSNEQQLMQTEPPPPVVTISSSTSAPIEETQPTITTGTTAEASNSSSDLPDGIDPTFLAALPDSIRQEVLAQYEREQQRNRSAPATSVSNTVPVISGDTNSMVGGGASGSSQSINPEVLAALPPEIQEEVCTIS